MCDDFMPHDFGRRVWPTRRQPIAGRDHVRAPREESLIVPDPFTDDDAVGGDLEQAEVLLVGTRADFDDRHHALELAVELDISLQDDRVGQKRRPVRTEPEIACSCPPVRPSSSR